MRGASRPVILRDGKVIGSSRSLAGLHRAPQHCGAFFLSTMFYIYILFSDKTNRYYIGSTDDLDRRLKHHNAGSTPSTKSGAPNWEI